jgi:hypothetical protein
MPIDMICHPTNLKTVTLKVAEEKNARIRLIDLKAKESESLAAVTRLQDKLTEEQRSYTHTNAQQVA